VLLAGAALLAGRARLRRAAAQPELER
jgi:hypothetical protein